MNARDFSRALRFEVPAKAERLTSIVYLDAALTVHGELVKETPVDTGFLRTSLGANTGAVGSRALRSRRVPGKRYSGGLDPAALKAIQVAAEKKQLLGIGYRAEYAPHVEDKRHMVKTVARRWPTILRGAVQRAGGA